MNKIFLLLCIFSCLSISSCPIKYGPPKVEDCITITSWDSVQSIDKATSFCVNQKMSQFYFENDFLPEVEKRFKDHPLKESVLSYLLENKQKIIQTKEYELPISYTRGYTQVSPFDREELTKWSEENRIERIKCENKP